MITTTPGKAVEIYLLILVLGVCVILLFGKAKGANNTVAQIQPELICEQVAPLGSKPSTAGIINSYINSIKSLSNEFMQELEAISSSKSRDKEKIDELLENLSRQTMRVTSLIATAKYSNGYDEIVETARLYQVSLNLTRDILLSIIKTEEFEVLHNIDAGLIRQFKESCPNIN